MKAIVLIPARFASTRFPGKPLAIINGKSMIRRVYENLNLSSKLDVYVVTDNEQIEEHVKSFGGKTLRVDDEVSTGSERIALALDRYFNVTPEQIVINVQGDEPLIDFHDIEKLFSEHSKNQWQIGTLFRTSLDSSEGQNPNRVKVTISASESGSFAHYFSRSPIPYFRGEENTVYKIHVGVYSYRADILKKFNLLPIGLLENAEKLEQLRALENEMRIHLIETKNNYIGVDGPDDIKIVEGVINGKT